MITIVDYGLGNVQAFKNVYKRLGIECRSASTAGELEGASRVILPGVGAFDHAMELLDASGMRSTLDNLALRQGVPVLGICVGMQILARSSDEGTASGLGWVEGTVRKFDAGRVAGPLRLPHMGWNDVQPVAASPLFEGLENDARFYFLHSYYFQCDRESDSVARAEYGGPFSCVVRSRNIHGVQFHPEKSHHWGTRLLKNFAELH
ncbi:imidazole glycerol phosphate synthase subunit HisH [Ramlibacter sp.]|uniref:imidazole glycerol phosphate synthase subunit HisH n=1 Tax=Ramlibacter sp. TaxID=1917967 RepID=UPI003D09B1ED